MIDTLFIEHEFTLYNVNYISSISANQEFITINFLNGQDLKIFSEKGTLSLKYNVIRHFLDVHEVYGKITNILTFDDINKPDIVSTDGIWKNQTVKKYEWIDKTKIKVFLSDSTIHIVNLKLHPKYQHFKNYLDKLRVYNGRFQFLISEDDAEEKKFFDVENEFIVNMPMDISSLSIPQKEFKCYEILSMDNTSLKDVKKNVSKERKSKKDEKI
jgi:hypothetical protein